MDDRVLAAVQEQLATWRELLAGGAQRVGWKAALAMPEIETLIGPQPVVGHLTTATQLEPGGTYRGGGVALRAETEVVIVVGEDGGPSAYGVGLEIVDVGREPATTPRRWRRSRGGSRLPASAWRPATACSPARSTTCRWRPATASRRRSPGSAPWAR